MWNIFTLLLILCDCSDPNLATREAGDTRSTDAAQGNVLL